MPQINIDEMVEDLKDHLPSQNELTDKQLESIATNIVENKIAENDEEKHYSEALCKALKVAGMLNDSKYSVDGASLLREKVGSVELWYSEAGQRTIWKDFIKSLPTICPYLPKGGYNMPTSIGIRVEKVEEVEVNPCQEVSKLFL